MIAAIFCYSTIGIVIGVVFSLLFINFDKSWKKIASSLCGFGGSGGFIVAANDFFNIVSQDMKFWTASFFFLSFLISFIIMLFIMCRLIKDKDDADALRIRDILLGQKSYIDKYYEARTKEIDEKLGIPILEAREQAVAKKEIALVEKEKYIEDEKERIEELGNGKIRLFLPEKANITLTKSYIEVMPSYINDIFKCINDINSFTKLFLEDIQQSENNYTKIKSYFISLAMYISQDIFGGKSTDVRIHFRIYDKAKNGYVKFVALIGEKTIQKDMTFIPYDDDSMIKKSYECKRALIKSINADHDFQSNNHIVWQDYLTFTFYNLKTNNIPYLSFGISVKNAERYKKLFYLINFFKLESYLQDNIEQVNEAINIENILYKEV